MDTINVNSVNNIVGYLDSMAIEQPDLGDIIIDAGHVYLDIEAVGGGDIHFWLNGTYYTLDCTTGSGVGGKARIEIPQGTSILDKFSIIFATWSEQESKIILASSEVFPNGVFLPICYISIQDYTTLTTNKPIVLQRTTECITHGEQGSISRMRENTRLANYHRWWSGVAPSMSITTNAGSRDNINLTFTSGVVYQMNRQGFPVIDISIDGLFLANIDNSGTRQNLEKLTDLGVLNETRNGQSLVDGDMIIVDIYGNINNNSDNCKVFAIPSDKVYTDEAFVKQVAEGADFYRIPTTMRTVAFPICRLILKYNTANSGTWTNILTDRVFSWKTNSIDIHSINYPSNYTNGRDDSNILTATAGITQIKVNFEDFITETNYDYVRIYDYSSGSRGSLLATYHGDLGSNWKSSTFYTNRIEVRFTSDGSVTRKGFKINSYDYYSEDAGAGGELIDKR